MNTILWINSKTDRDNMISALFHNGYTIRLIMKPNKEYPLTTTDYGIEIIGLK